MREMIKMIIVLTILSCFSGGVLAYLRNSTQDRIDNQVLEFVKGPAIREVFQGASNNPITDRFKLKDGDVERTFFVGIYDGEPKGVAFETSGKGFGGDVGLMVGINVKDNKLLGVSVTTQSEVALRDLLDLAVEGFVRDRIEGDRHLLPDHHRGHFQLGQVIRLDDPVLDIRQRDHLCPTAVP